MADDELIGDHERDKFASVTGSRDHDRDNDGVDDRREAVTGEGRDDYDRGRHDQAVDDEQNRPARFNRDDVAAEREPERRY